MAVHTAKIEGVKASELRTVTLAHPLRIADMTRMGLSTDNGAAEVGDKVKVTPDTASSLINAGYAQTDPEDADAVRAILHPETLDDDDEPAPAKVATGTKPRAADSQTPVAGTVDSTPSASGTSST